MTCILIAEDNVMISLMINTDLQRAGYETKGPFVRSAPALRAVDGCDLALVDIDLQNGDSGIELARALAADHGLPSLFVTGQIEQARRAGDAALGVLVKPFRSESLIGAVEAALAYAGGGSRPADAPGCVWF